jgi:hypothetical protein
VTLEGVLVKAGAAEDVITNTKRTREAARLKASAISDMYSTMNALLEPPPGEAEWEATPQVERNCIIARLTKFPELLSPFIQHLGQDPKNDVCDFLAAQTSSYLLLESNLAKILGQAKLREEAEKAEAFAAAWAERAKAKRDADAMDTTKHDEVAKGGELQTSETQCGGAATVVTVDPDVQVAKDPNSMSKEAEEDKPDHFEKMFGMHEIEETQEYTDFIAEPKGPKGQPDPKVDESKVDESKGSVGVVTAETQIDAIMHDQGETQEHDSKADESKEPKKPRLE